MRLLILIGLVYLLFRTARKRLFPSTLVKAAPPGPVADEMVRDPLCGVYFPRREGVALTRDGEELLFCSDRCRCRFADGERAGDGRAGR